METEEETQCDEIELPLLRPCHFIDLFLRPRRFFSSLPVPGNILSQLLIVWVYGISVIIKLATFIGGNVAFPESWTDFWHAVVLLNIPFLINLGGQLSLWLAWWYRLRLDFCGVEKPDKDIAYCVFLYSSLVYSVPVVLLTLLQTTWFPTPEAALHDTSSFSSAIWVVMWFFGVWSIYTSYCGATTTF